jgi:membrane protease YdiL (CAAX protease family)
MPSDAFVKVVLWCCALAVWSAAALRLRTGRSILRHEPRRPVPWQGVDLAIILLAFLVVGAIGHSVLREVQAPTKDQANPAVSQSAVPTASPSKSDSKSESKPLDPIELLTGGIVELVVAAIAIGWVMFRVRARPTDLGLSLLHFGADVLVGAAAFLAAAMPVFWLQDRLERIVPYQHPIIKAIESRPDASTFAVAAILAICVAPFAEELFFRVLIQGCLEAVEAKRRWLLQRQIAMRSAANPSASQQPAASPPCADAADNPNRSPAGPVRPIATEEELAAMSGPAAWPIVASSALFALTHWGQGPAPAPLFFFALVLGYVYQRTHRIWPSMVTHAMLNGTSMLMLWFSVKPA